MTLPDFVTGLELELRLRAVPFDRGELETWAADVWSLAEDDPDVIRGRGVPGGAARGIGGVKTS
jgi:hypothetical protein